MYVWYQSSWMKQFCSPIEHTWVLQKAHAHIYMIPLSYWCHGCHGVDAGWSTVVVSHTVTVPCIRLHKRPSYRGRFILTGHCSHCRALSASKQTHQLTTKTATGQEVYKELERVLYLEKSNLSIEKAAELTQNMYQITFTLPESKHSKSMLLNMDDLQAQLYQIAMKYF